MSFTNADLLAIKNELETDPLTLGYPLLSDSDNDVVNADALNLVREELQIDREAIPTHEIFLNIDRDEYVALAQADREWLNGVGQGGVVNPKAGGEVREGILQLFGAGTESRDNLQAILTESTSRIKQMFKQGLVSVDRAVTSSDVANARNAT